MDKEINLHLENFDGPLDLLLSLVKDKKMDIMEIDLSELATKYLKLIDKLKANDIDLAGEYLVMAATLIQLKARMLLERPEEKVEVEKDKEEILKQLAEYQQFKKISLELRKKELSRKNIFIKGHEDYDKFKKEIDESHLDGKSDAIKMIIALRRMFERVNAQKFREAKLEKFNFSPAERRLEIIEILKNNPKPSFDEIFSVPTMNHFVVTMVTVLDMARKQELKLIQDNQFEKINFIKGEING